MSEDLAVAPVTRAARVASLDILRGIAVLGILIMNIAAFALLPQAYVNPMAGGGADGANRIAFGAVMLLFEGTMRGIFSLLFGASIVLLTDRMERAGAGIMAAEVHFRRMLWMLVFGIIHWAVLLWWGEILFNYAMCGLLIFSLRKLRPRVLIGAAVLLLLLAAGIQTWRSIRTLAKHDAAVAAEAIEKKGAKLTDTQTRAIDAWREHVGNFLPTPEDAAKVRSWHSASYSQAVGAQFSFSYELQWKDAPYWLILDLIPFMLIGMALIQLGLLGATAPPRIYALMALAGYGVGLPLGWYELKLLLDSNFAVQAFAISDRTYEISRLAMVVGHLGLALLIIRAGPFGRVQRALGAVGQMALSNYVAQTIICTALFYGFGFGLFERLERAELLIVAAAIWVAQLIWSPIWLRFFRFGPLEWLWRSLTYWRLQPMRVPVTN